MTKQTRKAIPVSDVFREWRKDPDYVREFAALEDEFALAERSLSGVSPIEILTKS